MADIKPKSGDFAYDPLRLSDLIGAIYDCVLEPKNWGSTVARIQQEFSLASAVLGVSPLRPGAQIINVALGIDEEWLSVAESYTPDIIALWGGADRMQEYPVGEPILYSQTLGYRRRNANRYYREILAPRGLIDCIGIAIARAPSLVGYAAFNRHVSAGEVGDREMAGMRLLSPHLRRAVTVSDLFELRSVEATPFASLLDALAFGVVLVDENLSVIHANESARRMLSELDPIRICRGALVIAPDTSSSALKAAVWQAGRDETALGGRGLGIPALRRSGEPAVIHVLPLRRGELRPGLAKRAAAAVFIVPAGRADTAATSALALAYDLTPAELRVLDGISAGNTPSDIATELGVARSTVKTHLLHLFEKTGCRRQADLVKLTTQLSSPIGNFTRPGP